MNSLVAVIVDYGWTLIAFNDKSISGGSNYTLMEFLNYIHIIFFGGVALRKHSPCISGISQVQFFLVPLL